MSRMRSLSTEAGTRFAEDKAQKMEDQTAEETAVVPDPLAGEQALSRLEDRMAWPHFDSEVVSCQDRRGP